MSSRDFYAKSGVAPPNSFTRKNTIHQSVEEGDVAPNASGIEPRAEQSGKGTEDSLNDVGNAPEQPSPPSQQPITDTSTKSPSTTHQGSGLPEQAPSPAQTQKIVESKENSEAAQASPAKAPAATKKSTGVAAVGGDFDAAKKGGGKEAVGLRDLDRDVSPGEMADGSHAITSGDRGESYEPSAMSKLKNKFHISGNK